MSVYEVNKIQISVLHVDRNPWKRFVEEIQIPFWNRQSLKEISITFFYLHDSYVWAMLSKFIEFLRWRCNRLSSYGISYLLMFVLRPFRRIIPRSKLLFVDSSGFKHVVVNFPEMTSTMRWKRVAIFEDFLRTDSQFLVMITSTSILNIPILKRNIAHCINASNSRIRYFAAGPIGKSADGDFISGSFVVLGRSCVELLIRNLAAIPVHSMDDIALGVALRKLGVSLQELPSLSLGSEEQVNHLTSLRLSQVCHVRTSKNSDFEKLEAFTQNFYQFES